MRRADREVTDPGEITAAIRRYKVCTLGMSGEPGMRLVPMCFGFRDGCLYFHSAPEGEKISILRRDPRVVFEMGSIIEVVGDDDIHYESVIGHGTVEFLSAPEEKREGIRILLEWFSGSSRQVSDRALEGTCVFRVRIGSVSMKRNPGVIPKPVLETGRLLMRVFVPGDEEGLQRAADYSGIAEGTAGVPHPYTIDDASAFIQGRYNDFAGKTGGVFAIVEKESGEIVGCAGILRSKWDSAEIGYWITPGRWNRGYCTEAVERLIEYGFGKMELNRIFALHFPDNPGSGRVLEKAGMKREGLLRGYLKKGGEYRDAAIWAVTRQCRAPRRPWPEGTDAGCPPPADDGGVSHE